MSSPDDTSNAARYEEGIQKIKQRCNAAKFATDESPGFDGETVLGIEFPAGPTTRCVPLLQFLAFYQVVEFYYPMFSEKDAIHRLKIILKDPRFDPHIRDSLPHCPHKRRSRRT